MPHISVTVDGKSLMNANTERGRGANSLPQDLAAYLQPGARPEPWMKALLFAIGEAVMNSQDLSATVTTKAQGWALDVDMTPKHYDTRDDIWDPRNPGSVA